MNLNYLPFIFWILSLGCVSKKNGINVFFENFDRTLSVNEKKQIVECSDIGCLVELVHSNLSKKFSKAYSENSTVIDKLLIDSLKIYTPFDRARVLIMAYRELQIYDSVDYFKIKEKVIQFDRMQDSIFSSNYRNEIHTHNWIANTNYEKFEVGDSLNIQLPLGRDGNKKVVYYYAQYDKNNFKDTLFLKCLLLRKTKEKFEESELGKDESFFLLKIIEIKNKDSNLIDNKYRRDSIFSLPLYDYGRIIFI